MMERVADVFGVLENLHSLISTKFDGENAKNLRESLSSVQQTLEALNVPCSDVQERIQKCVCKGKKIFCLTSALIQAYVLYIDLATKTLDCSNATHSDQPENSVDLSVNQQNQLTYLLHFVVNVGIIRHLEFQISLLTPKPKVVPQCSSLDLLICCRHLISFCHNSVIRNLLLPKNLLPLLGGLMQLAYSAKFADILEAGARRWCSSALARLITKWSKLEDVITSLLMLQGSTSRSSPPWLLKACGSLLSKCLLKRDGVVSLLYALIPTFGNEMSDWKKSEVFSHILSTPPHSAKDKETYYVNISSQIIELLQSDNAMKEDSEWVLQMLVATVFALYSKSPEFMQTYFFNKLLQPFNACYYTAQETGNDLSDIGGCLKILHQLFALFKHPDKDTVIKEVLLPNLFAIFSLYCFSRNTISCLRSVLHDLIISCLGTFEGEAAASILLSLCGIYDEQYTDLVSTIKRLKAGLFFTFNEAGDVILSYEEPYTRPSEVVIADQDNKVQAIIEIMSSCKEKKVPTHVLILLIKNVSEVGDVSSTSDKLLLPEERASSHLQDGESHLITFAILMSICEHSNPSELLADVDHICSFIKAVLSKICKEEENKEISQTYTESLKTCFAILGLCMLSELTKRQQETMQELIPLLQEIASNDLMESNERETASDLSIAIATNGICSEVDIGSFSKSLQLQMEGLAVNAKDQESGTKIQQSDHPGPTTNDESKISSSSNTKTTIKKPLIEEISNNDHACKREATMNDGANAAMAESSRNDQPSTSSNKSFKKSKKSKRKKKTSSKSDNDVTVTSLNDAISSAYDPSPPIRAAACRYLSDLFRQGGKSTKENMEKICGIFIERLEVEDDSFVYLSVIQGLSEIVNSTPLSSDKSSNMLNRLIDEYDKHIRVCDEEAEVKAVKIGEVLVRVARQLGDLAPHHSCKLVPIFFRGSRNKRTQIRVSCLSNLGELSSQLGHSLGTFKEELSECVCSIARTDNEVMVRRAAIHVIRSLIETFGSNVLQIFPGNIKRFYSVLKHGYDVDEDDVIQLHSQLALEALDDIMRDAIFAENERKHRKANKRILILPPS